MGKIITGWKLRKSLWLLLLFPVLATGGPHEGRSATQYRGQSREQVISRIRKAHKISSVMPHAFDSYRFDGCMYIEQAALPRRAPNLKQNCVAEETGVLLPSLAYVSVLIGSTRIIELIDISQAKGWQITSTSSGSGGPLRSVSQLPKPKYEALLESTQHSLPALLGILTGPDVELRLGLRISYKEHSVVITWPHAEGLNEFWFDGQTFLCKKQVRRAKVGTTVLKFSNYGSVSNVMLPHTIVMVKEDGTMFATRAVRQWSLAPEWLKSSFDPDEIGGFD